MQNESSPLITPTISFSIPSRPLPTSTLKSPKQSAPTSTRSIVYGSGGIFTIDDNCSTDSQTSGLSTTSSSSSSAFQMYAFKVRDIIVQHTNSIGMLGSMAIAVNSLIGPAMLDLPALFARAGIIPTVATLILTAVVSSLGSLYFSKTIQRIPGNDDFQREMEYSDTFRHYWGSKWFLPTHCLFYGCITCLNISSIVDTAQVVDTFLGHWWPSGGSAAIQVLLKDESLSYAWVRWDYSVCTNDELRSGTCVPFQQFEGILFTAGTFITTLAFVPLALMDLKENAAWQIFGFFVLLMVCLQFVVQFTIHGLDPSNASWWGHSWSDLFGVVLFNFAMVVAIPSWLYSKEPEVDVPTVVYRSNTLSTVLYIAVGLLGMLAMPNVSDNMLESMMSGAFGTWLQLGASVFAFVIIGLDIPLCSVLSRLNLTGSGLFSTRTANILSVYMPFALSFFLYNGKAVTDLLSWGGVLFTSLVAFVLPIWLSLDVVAKGQEKESYDALPTTNDDCENSNGGWFACFKDKERSEVIGLRALLAFTIAAVIAALVGNIVS